MLERWTFLVLILAITKGAIQLCTASSYSGLLPSGCSAPSTPSVNANGLRNTAIRLRSLPAAAMVSLKLANVPPEKVPFIERTRPFTRGTVLPSVANACCCKKKTPKSKGTESKPQEKTMRAPLFLAASECSAIIVCIHAGSPQRST